MGMKFQNSALKIAAKSFEIYPVVGLTVGLIVVKFIYVGPTVIGLAVVGVIVGLIVARYIALEFNMIYAYSVLLGS